MSADKYPSIFSRQMEAIVYIWPVTCDQASPLFRGGYEADGNFRLRHLSMNSVRKVLT